MGFAVLHIEKGTAGKGKGLGNHIDRTKNVPNADPKLRHLNFYIRNGEKLEFTTEPHSIDLQERIKIRIKEGYKSDRAIRKDAVTHLNIVLTGSHEEMKEIENGKNNEFMNWVADNYIWAAKKYGVNNIVEFAVHRDERTPHIHLVVVPLTKDGRLSAKEVIGDSRKLSATQDEYAAAMAERFQGKLNRGFKGGKATHDSIREFYARVNDSQSTDLATKNAQLTEELRRLRKNKIARMDELIEEIVRLKESRQDRGHHF